MSAPADLTELLARVRALEDERDVIRTLHRYGHALDAGDEDAWVDLFTEHGTFSASGRDPGHTTFSIRGREELRAFVAGHSRPPHGHHQHHVAEPLVTLDGDTATCRSTMFVVMDHEQRPVLRVFGRYEDRLERGDDGAWRFTARVAAIDAMQAGLPPLVGAMSA
jgi:ketosteroid isomerase-like protein